MAPKPDVTGERSLLPLVSVVIPTYDRCVDVQVAIQSVLDQDYPQDRIEIIVVDDGGSDDTAQVLAERWGARLRVVRKPNGGVSSARNHGAGLATGTLLAFLDSDDWWRPSKLTRQQALLAADPTCAIALTDLDVHERNLGPDAIHLRRRDTQYVGDEVALARLVRFPDLAPSCMLVRRAIYRELGGFDESLPTAEDIDFLLRIAARHRIANVEEPLTVTVRHETGGGGLSNLARTTRDFVGVIERFVASHELDPDVAHAALFSTYVRNARTSMWNGDVSYALECLARGGRHVRGPEDAAILGRASLTISRAFVGQLRAAARPLVSSPGDGAHMISASLRRLKRRAAPAVKRLASDAVAASRVYDLFGRRYGGLGTILMFHRVIPAGAPNVYPGYMIDAGLLDELVTWTLELGWEPVTLDEAAHRIADGSARDRRFVAFTFDDGYVDNLTIARPLFARHGVPFSVYLCSGILERSIFYWWGVLQDLVLANGELRVEGPDGRDEVVSLGTIDEKLRGLDLLDGRAHAHGPEFVRQLAARYGVDPEAALDRDAMTFAQARELAADPLVTIGGHCVTHQRLSKMTEVDARHELTESKRVLEEKVGVEVRHLAYPFGASDACGAREFAAARDAGYVTAVTTRRGNVFAGHRDHMLALPRRNFPTDRVGLRNALFGVETLLRREPIFQVE